MIIKAATLALVLLLVALCTSSSTGASTEQLSNIAEQMDLSPAEFSEMELALLEYNLSRSYHHDLEFMANPVHYDRNRGVFTTSYFIHPSSSLNQADTKTFHATLNSHVSALVIGLVQQVFSLKYNAGAGAEVENMLEVEFRTVDEGLLYIVGRYSNGELSLIREQVDIGGQ